VPRGALRDARGRAAPAGLLGCPGPGPARARPAGGGGPAAARPAASPRAMTSGAAGRRWYGRQGSALSPPCQLLCGSGAIVRSMVQGGCCAALTATGRRLRSAASALWVAAAGACEVGGLYPVRLGLQEWLAWRVHVCALFLQA